MTDALLTRIAGGDVAAVDDFVRRHRALVWGQARRFCRDAHEVEDAVQEIFFDVWRSAGRYDPELGSETAFVATIARRRLVDRVRRTTRRPRAGSLDAAADVAAPAERDDAALRDDAARARAAMEHLRPEQREVLELSLGHGRTHQEIAAGVGIPLGTVKSHARRGLIRLRRMLGLDAEGGAGGAA